MTIQFSKPSKYSNLSYTFNAYSFTPDKGFLNYALLKHNVQVAAILSNKEELLSEYKHAMIMLAYKQVKSKAGRSKKRIDNLLYRDNIEQDIKTYIQTSEFNDYDETKILLLNDEQLDVNVGDTGLQCMLSFEKYDGTFKFYLSPGSAIKQLTEAVGLGILEFDSVDDILTEIITDMSDMVMTNIIPNSNIQSTTKLKEDVVRYLHFCLYGD